MFYSTCKRLAAIFALCMLAMPASAEPLLDELQKIFAVCSNDTVADCRTHLTGESPEGRVFLSLIVLVKAHAASSELYESRYGRSGLESWQRMIMFQPTAPIVTLVTADEHEALVEDEAGNRFHMVSTDGDWKLDLSRVTVVLAQEKVNFLQDLAGHYLKVGQALRQGRSNEDIEMELLIGASSISAMLLPADSEQLEPMMAFLKEMRLSLDDIRQSHSDALDLAVDRYAGKRTKPDSTAT